MQLVNEKINDDIQLSDVSEHNVYILSIYSEDVDNEKIELVKEGFFYATDYENAALIGRRIPEKLGIKNALISVDLAGLGWLWNLKKD